jgi:6-phosphogluconate dehydrogenase
VVVGQVAVRILTFPLQATNGFQTVFAVRNFCNQRALCLLVWVSREEKKAPVMGLMPIGPKEAYDLVEPIFTKCAAQVGDYSCTGYLGPVGAGNYVKMVHNGIEYGDMQLIAEVYDVLKNVLFMSNDEMADLFDEWNKSELSSYLIEITSKILRKEDDLTGGWGYVVDYILDKTGMKGTGKWTIQEAADKGVVSNPACLPWSKDLQ